MARDPMQVLWRVRDAAVREARRALAAAQATQLHQASLLRAHHEAMGSEQKNATGPLLTVYTDWLPHARRQADGLRAKMDAEQARVARLQHALVVCRTEAEAVVKVIERLAEQAALVRARKDQAAMDEAAGRAAGRRVAGL